MIAMTSGFVLDRYDRSVEFSLIKGWNFIDLEASFTVEKMSVAIYFDIGHGFDNSKVFYMSLRNGKVTKRICYFPLKTVRVKIVPVDSGECFFLESVKFVWLTPFFARDRILHRLSNFHPEFRFLSKQEIKKELCKDKIFNFHWIKSAFEYYSETFEHYDPQVDFQNWLLNDRSYKVPLPVNPISNIKNKLRIFLLIDQQTLVDDVKNTLQSLSEQGCLSFDVYFIDSNSSLIINEYIALKKYYCFYENDDLSLISERLNDSWVGFFKAGDLFSNDFVSAFYGAIDEKDIKILYFDEDRFDSLGNRLNPVFKSGWNPDLLFSCNYFGSGVLFELDSLSRSPKLREFYSADELHQLLLEQTYDLEVSQIHHIPQILYHRKIQSEVIDSPTVPVDKSNKDILNYLISNHGVELVRNDVAGLHHIIWPLPHTEPLVSLLVPTRDGIEILKPCIDKILSLTSYPCFEVLILNNQSSCKETLDYFLHISKDSRVRVLDWDFSFNYSAINNFGARHANGEIIGLVNNDIEPINADWLTEMVRQVCREEIGCVGAKLYYPNDTIQHAGVVLGIGGVAGHSHRFLPRSSAGYCNRLNVVQNYSAVTGACLLVRKSVYDQVGGLTEELAVAFNDVDLCLKVRSLGLRNLWTPYAELYHHESISRGADNTPKKRKRALKEAQYMKDHWGALLECDPAYNPNLTLMHEDFSLR
ncbi:glycosyltransferase [Neptunomonas phycophila]|uniref:glycosyltransferase family 2 protein n=1 Tax=Neptunomonas phycophila TaxID=1572645 RepID=UPI0026E4000A|nr:glycosyltransferase [Neptunomonas phycophila]MDO6782511.1 glycosyltransferase [Neptunomonas phycophila]